MLEAEARALYFGELASYYTTRKQIITGGSFFLSSGAAVTIIANVHPKLAAGFALIVAAAMAYSMAMNLDGRILTMSKLHGSWSRISSEYGRLWNHAYDDNAEATLDKLIDMEREPSELATTNAPNDPDRLGKWEDHVIAMYRGENAA